MCASPPANSLTSGTGNNDAVVRRGFAMFSATVLSGKLFSMRDFAVVLVVGARD